MRRIDKGDAPPSLDRWRKENTDLNCRYDDISSQLRVEIKERLLREQGWLCAYTGMRVTGDSSHIEHIKPQHICRTEGSMDDTEWANMIGAWPGDRTSRAAFGAHAKDEWHEPERFVSPLSPGCEQRFSFSLSGKIGAAKPDDDPALETIRRLRLDHDHLTERRRQVIEDAVLQLSDRQVERLIESIDQPDREGRLTVFCFAVKQACAELLRRRHRERERRAGIRRVQ